MRVFSCTFKGQVTHKACFPPWLLAANSIEAVCTDRVSSTAVGMNVVNTRERITVESGDLKVFSRISEPTLSQLLFRLLDLPVAGVFLWQCAFLVLKAQEDLSGKIPVTVIWSLQASGFYSRVAHMWNHPDFCSSIIQSDYCLLLFFF